MTTTTYRIVRIRVNARARRSTNTRLTLDEAQRFCRREDTHGGIYCWECKHRNDSGSIQKGACPKCGSEQISRSWFDGYEEE